MKTSYYTFYEKEIIFVPIVHFGKTDFYETLKDSVIGWKKNNHTIFYEEIQMEENVDSLTQINNLLKLRRIVGGLGTRESYDDELSDGFKNSMAQPEYDYFTIDSTDLNVDITYQELITETERLYGQVKLTDCDYQTPIDSTYECKTRWKKSMINSIIVDYRNQNVVDYIVKSTKRKIVVLYGADHIKGMKKN